MRVIFGLISLRSVVSCVTCGVLIGWLTAWAGDGGGGPQVYPDFECKDDKQCEGVLSVEGECDDTDCVGQKTTAKFSACFFTKTKSCTADKAKYGSVTCPGICKNIGGRQCSIEAVGCK